MIETSGVPIPRGC